MSGENAFFDPQGEYNRDAGGWLIAEGLHVFIVSEAVIAESKAGNRQLVVESEVREPGHADDLRTLKTYYVYTNEGSLARLQEMCLAIDPKMVGVHRDPKGFDIHSQESVSRHLIGQVYLGDVIHEDQGTWTGQDGKERPNIKQRIETYKTADPGQRARASNQATKPWDAGYDEPAREGSATPWSISEDETEKIPF